MGSESALKMALWSTSMPTRTQRRCVASPRSTRVRRERANVSAQHIDFMIGSAELDVDGVTADGEGVPVLRKLAWQL